MKGVHAEQLPSYLDELMWRERYGIDPSFTFTSILADLSIQYPVVMFKFSGLESFCFMWISDN